jgi:hypothetical protein
LSKWLFKLINEDEL